ncbi:hypothetical protein [Brucella pseudogrignonensis]|uniref:hypothetical protein n=1 Tax=Brucella pseudogrignonensis TaxID=419475 RepID=UPI0038D00B05
MQTAVDRGFSTPPGSRALSARQGGGSDEFTMMRSADAISITGMKLAIISKAAALWKFVFVGYGVGSGLRAVQLADAALRFI